MGSKKNFPQEKNVQAGMTVKMPLIFNIQRFSIHDGGGIRTIIFFKGCPLHCPWCSNPEGISDKRELLRNNQRCIQCCAADAFQCINSPEICPVNALSYCGEAYSINELVEEIAKDQIMYDEDGGGLTLSGGEPFLFPDFLSQLFPRLKPWLNSIAVETCGYVPFENIEKVMGDIDIFLYDLKIMNREKFLEVCGGELSIVIENISKLVSNKKNVIPRIPLIPTYTDSYENIDAIAELVTSLGLREVHLLPFHQMGSGKYDYLGLPYTLEDLKPPSIEQVSEAISHLESKGLQVILGGL